MRILCLNDSMGDCPSFRARVVPFLPMFRREGTEVECSSSPVTGRTRADVVWLRRRLLRKGEAEALAGTPIVYDFDDATYLSGEAFKRTIGASKSVLAGSRRLAAEAEGAGCPRVVLLRTGVESGTYPAADHGGRPVVLWTGSRTTVPYLETAAPALEKLAGEGVRVRVVADARPKWGVPTEFVMWHPATEKEAFRGASVGISPVPDVPYARGKCAYKVVQYMAAGLPVVASDVGANKEIFDEFGCEGSCMKGTDDFYSKISAILSDAERRREMGRRNADSAKRLDVGVLFGTLADELRKATG